VPDSPPDFRLVLERLNSERVRFVLVGGLAMVAHGSSHVTRDIDICYEREPENLAALAGAIATLHPTLRGAPADLPFIWTHGRCRRG